MPESREKCGRSFNAPKCSIERCISNQWLLLGSRKVNGEIYAIQKTIMNGTFSSETFPVVFGMLKSTSEKHI